VGLFIAVCTWLTHMLDHAAAVCGRWVACVHAACRSAAGVDLCHCESQAGAPDSHPPLGQNTGAHKPGLHALLTHQGAPCYLSGVDNARQKAAPLASHPRHRRSGTSPEHEVLADCRFAAGNTRRRPGRIQACENAWCVQWARCTVERIRTLE
jgi:hypothetical protein